MNRRRPAVPLPPGEAKWLGEPFRRFDKAERYLGEIWCRWRHYEHGGPDMTVNKGDEMENQRSGLFGEWALYDYLGFDASDVFRLTPDGGVCDLVLPDERVVEVKGTKHADGGLVFTETHPLRADFAVLVTKHAEDLRHVAGWVTPAQWEERHYVKELKPGVKVPYLDQQYLNPIVEFPWPTSASAS